jgi:hypothetical protein
VSGKNENDLQTNFVYHLKTCIDALDGSMRKFAGAMAKNYFGATEKGYSH